MIIRLYYHKDKDPNTSYGIFNDVSGYGKVDSNINSGNHGYGKIIASFSYGNSSNETRPKTKFFSLLIYAGYPIQ